MSALRGHYLTAYVLVSLAAVPLLMGVGVALALCRRVTVRITSDPTGFTIWPDRRYQWLLYASLALAVSSAALAVVHLQRGAIEISMSQGMQMYALVMFSAVALTALGGLIAGVRRGGAG